MVTALARAFLSGVLDASTVAPGVSTQVTAIPPPAPQQVPTELVASNDWYLKLLQVRGGACRETAHTSLCARDTQRLDELGVWSTIVMPGGKRVLGVNETALEGLAAFEALGLVQYHRAVSSKSRAPVVRLTPRRCSWCHTRLLTWCHRRRSLP